MSVGIQSPGHHKGRVCPAQCSLGGSEGHVDLGNLVKFRKLPGTGAGLRKTDGFTPARL